MPKNFRIVFKRKRYGHNLGLYIVESPEHTLHYIVRARHSPKALQHETLSDPYETVAEAILAALEHTLSVKRLRSDFYKNIQKVGHAELCERSQHDLFNTTLPFDD